jgi:hypothetical protein
MFYFLPFPWWYYKAGTLILKQKNNNHDKFKIEKETGLTYDVPTAFN